MTTTRMTNYEFAEKVGCDFTTASRLKNGQRLPSRNMLININRAFGLDMVEMLEACDKGSEVFGEYLTTRVFEVESAPDPESDPDSETPSESDGDDEVDADDESKTA